MAKPVAVKRKSSESEDVTIEAVEEVVGGETYRMCLDFRSLRLAERELNRAGRNINILAEYPKLTMDSTCIMFGAAIHRLHPDIKFEDALEMLADDLPAAYRVANAIGVAWSNAMSLNAKGSSQGNKNPTQPGS
jgi:hypothetical protein